MTPPACQLLKYLYLEILNRGLEYVIFFLNLRRAKRYKKLVHNTMII